MSNETIQEYQKFVNEINKGMEEMKRLRASASGYPNQQVILDKMVASYTEAALILDGGVSSQGQSEVVRHSDILPDDGYMWSEYEQKDILGAKYPRAYYRCVHNATRNCLATKHTQLSDEDPPKWRIEYQGKHTCIEESNASF